MHFTDQSLMFTEVTPYRCTLIIAKRFWTWKMF